MIYLICLCIKNAINNFKIMNRLSNFIKLCLNDIIVQIIIWIIVIIISVIGINTIIYLISYFSCKHIDSMICEDVGYLTFLIFLFLCMTIIILSFIIGFCCHIKNIYDKSISYTHV